jgi:L-ascorbate metabolism protein UlaG (beta-lactamase superfamily)
LFANFMPIGYFCQPVITGNGKLPFNHRGNTNNSDMQVTFYGHACFGVMVNGKKLLFDPFITGNELAKHLSVAEVAKGTDYILISHGHADHLADAAEMARLSGAKIICAWEIYEWLGKQGLENFHPMNTGGALRLDFGTVKTVVAQHSSGLPDGSYGGNPMGFVVTSTEGNFYYSGDTALTLDMQLIPRWAKLDFAVLPIGDNFTMGYADAAEAAIMAGAPKVLGVHYDTFGFIKIDHRAATDAFAAAGVQLHLVPIGQTVDL